MEAFKTQKGAPIDPIVQTVLDTFQTVFVEPTGLPPFRGDDHQI